MPLVKYERGSGFLDGLRNSKLHRTVLRIPITRTAASPLDGQKPRGARRRSQLQLPTPDKRFIKSVKRLIGATAGFRDYISIICRIKVAASLSV